jgi:hypothetical protein
MLVLQKGKSKLKPKSGMYAVNSAFTTVGMGDAAMRYGRWRRTGVDLAGLERDRDFSGPVTVIHKPEEYVGMFETGLDMEIIYQGIHRVILSRPALDAISRYPGFVQGAYEGTKPKDGFEAPTEDVKVESLIKSFEVNNIDSLPRDWLRIIAKMR